MTYIIRIDHLMEHWHSIASSIVSTWWYMCHIIEIVREECANQSLFAQLIVSREILEWICFRLVLFRGFSNKFRNIHVNYSCMNWKYEFAFGLMCNRRNPFEEPRQPINRTGMEDSMMCEQSFLLHCFVRTYHLLFMPSNRLERMKVNVTSNKP